MDENSNPMLTLKVIIYKIIVKYYKYLKPIIIFLLPANTREFLINDYKQTIALPLQEEVLGKVRLNNKKVVYSNNKFINLGILKTSPLGVNIIGFIKNSFGLSQQAINIGTSLIQANIETGYIDCSYLSQAAIIEHSEVEQRILEKNIYSCNLLSLNADMFVPLYLHKGKKFFANRYNIHYGAWELAQYPKEWLAAGNIVDEFWAMSRFVQTAVQQSLPIPAILMPYAIDFEIPRHIIRQDFNLPLDKFLFMFSYDMSSLRTRKNPQAVIKAFNIAFPKDQNIGLVVKLSRVQDKSSHIEEMNNLQEMINKDDRIFLIDEILTNEKMKGLINVCDAYISLHRAEGFGMGMAEAMKMGKAVIATNYSGNTDFTTPETACMVDYKLIDIKPHEYVHYELGQVWADPYVEHAAEYMQKLYNDSEFYKKIASNGKHFIDTYYNHQIIGQRFLDRLKIIGCI